jgi:hypothetical protein
MITDAHLQRVKRHEHTSRMSVRKQELGIVSRSQQKLTNDSHAVHLAFQRVCKSSHNVLGPYYSVGLAKRSSSAYPAPRTVRIGSASRPAFSILRKRPI